MTVIWLTILTANKRCEAVHSWVFVYMLEFYFAFKTQFRQALVSHARRNLESSLWKTSWNSRKNISPVMVDGRVIKVNLLQYFMGTTTPFDFKPMSSDDYSKLWSDVITLSKKFFFISNKDDYSSVSLSTYENEPLKKVDDDSDWCVIIATWFHLTIANVFWGRINLNSSPRASLIYASQVKKAS